MQDKAGSSKRSTIVVGLIVIGLAIVGFFGLRTIRAFREFRGHRPPPLHPFATQHVETNVDMIRDWMTIPFISRMYHIPPPMLFEALNIPEEKENREKSLKQLNAEYYPQTDGIVLEKVKAAVRAALANQPQPIPTVSVTPTVP